MNTTFKIIISSILFFFTSKTYSTIITSNCSGGGAWGSAATWITNVPVCGDTIQIKAGDIITVEVQQDYSEPGCTLPMFISIDGTLDFPVNGPKLRLPCNSGVTINTGGSLTASGGGGGGSANFLEICNAIVWKKADGTQTGPLTFGDPLPIELISFEAIINETRVDIKWITASEINNDYFTVEKSKNTKKWKSIITTSGAGNSNQIMEYFETDYKPWKGISYYRLKQTDFNGQYSYSNIIPIKNINIISMDLFPNPVKPGEQVNLQLKNIFGSEVLVVIRNIEGKEFYSKLIINISDGDLIGIPLDITIPSGTYLVTASNENQIYGKKLIIK